jgi:hypothetical protein
MHVLKLFKELVTSLPRIPENDNDFNQELKPGC